MDMNNKENFRTDNYKASVHTSSSNGKHTNKAGGDNSSSSRKERRSFKCERLSNIFSRDSSNKEKEKGICDSARKINSAPVYRKNISSSKFDDEDLSSGTGKGEEMSEMTTFPFDREAIDYERIQRECFTFEEEYRCDDEDYNSRSVFSYDFEDTEDSPSYEMLDQKIAPIEGIFQQYAMISQHEKERQNKKRAQSPTIDTTTTAIIAGVKSLSKIEHINRKLNETSALIHEQPANSNLTSPIPDLKIDFFSEPSVMASSSYSRENEKGKSDALDECQLKSTSSFCSKNTMSNNNVNSNINGSINLTSNPMSTAVCTTPRATIVVQQVCLIDTIKSHLLYCL